jgi:hypothetical protein
MKRLPSLVLVIMFTGAVSAQINIEPDTIIKDSLAIVPQFTTSEAWKFVDHGVQTNRIWHSQNSPVRETLQRLLDHSIVPFDSVRSRLIREDFRQFGVESMDPVVSSSTKVRWLNDSTFLVDPKGWSPDLYLKRETRLIYPKDTNMAVLAPVPADNNPARDSASMDAAPRLAPDTLIVTLIDTAAIKSLGIALHNIRKEVITPVLDKGGMTGVMSADRSRILYYYPGTAWKTTGDSPFSIVEGKYQLDSLQYAIDKLLEFTDERDSTILWLNDMHGNRDSLWLTGGDDMAFRFWVKNYNNDSITIWVGNPASHEISLMLEDDININRLKKEEILHLPEFLEIPQRSLVPMTMLEPEPVYWDYTLGSVFTMNQTYLSNWTKGGESSFSTMLDLTGEAVYNNKEARTQWINSVRVNFGTLNTKENGFRKNNDLFEINSKFNRNAWGKIGMSSSFYMKNQLAKGYTYPNDSVVVSKFLNPATLTVGVGFEYKPYKSTTLNVAPLSYKNTFVLDTAMIDQTKYGIDKGKRSKQEMGAQVVFNNKIAPLKDLSIENRVRLFSSYLNKPQNVDVDWELIMDQRINWFFTIRVNLHLVYDDDTRFPVLDSGGIPVLLPDGSQKKVAKTQFKEFIGLSLQFKF